MIASLSRLQSFYGELKAPLLLHAAITREFPRAIAVFTTFAADAGLLLSMVAEIEPATPVLFLDDGSHPPDTLEYGRRLCAHLGLTRLHPATPDSGPEPLAEALDTLGILALITGRTEGALPRIELDEGGVFRINPLVGWRSEARRSEMQKRNIPLHPLALEAASEPEVSAEAAAASVDWSV